jgi:N-acetylneuraminate lyase
MKKITGLVAAAYNPMHSDESIAPEKIGELVNYSVRQRFAGLFVNGSTGEFPSLTTRERQVCAEAYLESARGRLPVILNIASCSIEELRALAEHGLKHDVDAFCLMMPFYFKPANARDFADFAKEAAKFCGGKPLFLYHAAGLTGGCFDLPEFLRIMLDEVPSFGGVKYTGSDLFEFRQCMTISPRLQLLYGRDEMLLGALAMGAEAAIGTTFNYLPRVYRGVIDAFHANEMDKARELMDVSRRAVLVARNFGISSLKLFMKYAGIDVGPMRMPCNRITPEQEKAFVAAVRNADLEQYLG